MSLNALAPSQALLANPVALRAALLELQGGQVEVIDGAAAGTAMSVPLIRPEDTIIQAIVLADTWAAPTSDKANITIQPVKATATLTVSGNPVAGETITIGGNVYTWKAVPTKMNEVLITPGNNNAMAASLSAAINAYENRYESQLNGDSQRTARLVASVASAVVTLTAVDEGTGNAPQVTGTATVLAAAGSNTGSATLTPVTVVATNTAVINGVTFTASATPTGDVQFYTKAAAPAFAGGGAAGTDLACGQYLAKLINAYQFKYGTLDVVATAHATTGVVTITPMSAPTGNAIALAEASTGVAASGSYLAGGTSTGSIKSTTGLSTSTLILFWTNKK